MKLKTIATTYKYMNNYIIDKPINKDKEFFGYTMRTRHKFYDEKIIRSVMDETMDMYRLPNTLKFVIDIGANIGCFSLLAAKRGAKVLAFEPANINFDVLKYNIDKNGFSDKVECIKTGVGKPGETKLYMNEGNSGAISAYHYNKRMSEEYQLCNFISIADVFKNYNIEHCDILKLDCEGSEEDIIRDFNDDIAAKVDQISLEIHGNKHVRAELINILSKWYDYEHTGRKEFVFFKRK